MKVLKFNGASVGSIKNLQQVKKIVEGVNEPVVIVVSAVDGVTDKLIATTHLAAEGSEAYTEQLNEIISTHRHLAEGIIPTPLQESALSLVDSLHGELENILRGVFLIKELTPKTYNAILSYGERISALIISRFVDGVLIDARNIVKTTGGAASTVDVPASYRAIQSAFTVSNQRSVVPGFIGSATDTGEVTTLGRGGSDYTAALIAAALRVREVDLWGNTPGFMTADPQVISKAYPIRHLSYSEAMELCNFGAKVLFPPTIYPASSENITIVIKNINDPEAQGSVISNNKEDDGEKTIKGISSISDTALVTVQGMGMLSIPNVNSRVFSCLFKAGIRSLFVSEASSGSSISIGVKASEAEPAVRMLRAEFDLEMAHGAISSITAESGMAIIAIVGDNMKQTTGTAGKLCNALWHWHRARPRQTSP